MCTVCPKPTTKMTHQRVIANDPTKEIKQIIRKDSINPKAGRKRAIKNRCEQNYRVILIISIITLNVKDLNIQLKGRIVKLNEKPRPDYMFKTNDFKFKGKN